MKKQFLLFLIPIIMFLSFSIAFSAKADENSILISHWDFNEGSGNIIHDSIGGHNAALNGLAQWGDGYIDFNSGNRDVANGHANTGYFPSTRNFTLIISVKVGYAQGDSSFLYATNGFIFQVPGNTQSVKLEGFGVNDYIGVEVSSYAENKIALVHNGTDIKIFKNGQYIKTFNNVAPMSGGWDWYFGGNVSYRTSQFDDVKLYNIALTNDDIATEFNNGAVSCTEDTWSCSTWNECSINGVQARNCTKTYDCSVANTLSPSISQACTPTCTANNYSCSDWITCSINGSQTRTCNKIYNCSGGVQMPATSQSCTYVPPTCTSFTYSDWGTCQSNGIKTRTIITQGPENCTGGNPVLNESCAYIPACTANHWSCTGWNTCSQNGQQTRTCNKVSNCQGGVSSPATTQSCTYIPPIPSCTSSHWQCTDWDSCSVYGTQTRTCTKTSNCQGGVSSPATSQSCNYVPQCTSYSWSCGSWSSCSSNGSQTRTCNKNSNCEGGTPSPATTQSCTYTPACSADTWQCGSWGTCSPQGIQTRSCTKTYDCPSAETAAPATSQYCVAPNQPKQQTPSEDLGISNQDTIVRATVKLICPVSSTMASQGSGTVINSTGLILTNKHVIDGTAGCWVGFIDDYDDEPYFGDRQIADIYKISSDADAAILKLRNPNSKSLAAVNVSQSNSSSIQLGQILTTYGYPAKFGTKITYTSGDFSGVDGDYLKTTAVIEHGNSGGGAYLKNGKFIGIPTAVVKGSLNSMGYLLSVNKVNSWLNNSIAYNYNNNNNNYSRVSALLEDMDLGKLDSLGLFVAGDEIGDDSNNNETIKEQKPAAKIDAKLSNRLKGKLLLQVEDRGRIWYVNPDDAQKHEVTFANALPLFQKFALGITNKDLASVPLNTETRTSSIGNRLKGKLLLQVEDRGRIWYVDFNGKKWEVTWANLMELFESLALGITNADLGKIESGSLE